jgi:hypothetical protein
MKTRSKFEICLPLTIFVIACAASIPTLIIAVAWMTIGVVALGHFRLESFPTDGIRREWLKGYRSACLWFYHLAWWPWYMRSSLKDFAIRIRHPLLAGKTPVHLESQKSPECALDDSDNGDGPK